MQNTTNIKNSFTRIITLISFVTLSLFSFGLASAESYVYIKSSNGVLVGKVTYEPTLLNLIKVNAFCAYKYITEGASCEYIAEDSPLANDPNAAVRNINPNDPSNTSRLWGAINNVSGRLDGFIKTVTGQKPNQISNVPVIPLNSVNIPTTNNGNNNFNNSGTQSQTPTGLSLAYQAIDDFVKSVTGQRANPSSNSGASSDVNSNTNNSANNNGNTGNNATGNDSNNNALTGNNTGTTNANGSNNNSGSTGNSGSGSGGGNGANTSQGTQSQTSPNVVYQVIERAVPGPQGPAGKDGVNGKDGQNAQASVASFSGSAQFNGNVVADPSGNSTFNQVDAKTVATNNLSAVNATITKLTATNFDVSNMSVGSSTLGNLNSSSATITNSTSTNLFSTNASITNSTSTSLFSTNASLTNATATNLFSSLLTAISAAFTNLFSANATITNSTSTNLFSTNGSITNSTSTNLFSTNASITNSTSTNLFSTNASITNSTSTNLFSTNASITNSTSTNVFSRNASTTNSTSTNLFSTNASITNSTSTNLYTNNASIVNATSTNLFSTNASLTNATATNLFSSLLTAISAAFTNLTATLGTITTLFGTTSNFFTSNASTSNATTTNAVIGNIDNLNTINGTITNLNTSTTTTQNLRVTGSSTLASTTISNLTVTGSIASAILNAITSTFTNLISTNATLTNATTSNLTISSAANGWLYGDNNGNVRASSSPTVGYITATNSTSTFKDISLDGSMIPALDNVYSLGSPDRRFKDLYVSSSTIFIDNIGLSNINGQLTWGGTGIIASTTIGSSTLGATTITEATITNATITNLFTSNIRSGLTNGFVWRGSASGVSEATSTLFIANNGLIGIGTAAPSSNLTINQGTLTGLTQGGLSLIGTWNNAGTIFKGIDLDITNTNSNTNSTLFNLALAGASVFKVTAAGNTLITGNLGVTGTTTFNSPLDAGSNKITNVAYPTNLTDAANKAYVDSFAQGVFYQAPVITISTTSIVGPVAGDRYIIGAGSSGSTCTFNQVAEFNGTIWVCQSPATGTTIYANLGLDQNYNFNGSAWVQLGSTISHQSLSNVQGGSAGEYYHVNAAQYASLNSINAQLPQLLTTGTATQFVNLTLTGGLNIAGGAAGATITNATFTNITVMNNAAINNATSTNSFSTTASSTNLFSATSTLGSANVRSLWANMLTALSAYIGTLFGNNANFITLNASTTNATTSNADTGNITTLNSQTGNITNLNATNATATNLYVSGLTNFAVAPAVPLANGFVWRGSASGIQQATNTLFLANNGNVGIGTTVPANALHIASSTGFTSGLRLGFTSLTTASTSSSGKILTVDSDGNIVLAASAGGGGGVASAFNNLYNYSFTTTNFSAGTDRCLGLGNGLNCANTVAGTNVLRGVAGGSYTTDWEFFESGGVTYGVVSQYYGSPKYAVYRWIPSQECWGNAAGTTCHDGVTQNNNAVQTIGGTGSYPGYQFETFISGSDIYGLAQNTNTMRVYKWIPALQCFGNSAGSACTGATPSDNQIQEFVVGSAPYGLGMRTYTVGGIVYGIVQNIGGFPYHLDNYVYRWIPGLECFGNAAANACANTTLGLNSVQAVKGDAAQDIEFFTRGTDQYMIFHNYGYSVAFNTMIYKWDEIDQCWGDEAKTQCASSVTAGTGGFVQKIGNTYAGFSSVTDIGGDTYMITGAYSNVMWLYKWNDTLKCFGDEAGTLCGNTTFGANNVQTFNTSGNPYNYEFFTYNGRTYFAAGGSTSYLYIWNPTARCFGNEAGACANTTPGTNVLQSLVGSTVGFYPFQQSGNQYVMQSRSSGLDYLTKITDVTTTIPVAGITNRSVSATSMSTYELDKTLYIKPSITTPIFAGVGVASTTVWDALVVNGAVRARGFIVDQAADLAESFPTESGESIRPGTVVAFSDKTADWEPGGLNTKTYNMSTIKVASTTDRAIGVIATNPGFLLGGRSGSPVAFSGRIPVLVTNENGTVVKGDRLTLSETVPGSAMKQTMAGNSLGIALSDDTGDGNVLLFVNLGYSEIDKKTNNETESMKEAKASSTIENIHIFSSLTSNFSFTADSVKRLFTEMSTNIEAIVARITAIDNRLKVLEEWRESVISGQVQINNNGNNTSTTTNTQWQDNTATSTEVNNSTSTTPVETETTTTTDTITTDTIVEELSTIPAEPNIVETN